VKQECFGFGSYVESSFLWHGVLKIVISIKRTIINLTNVSINLTTNDLLKGVEQLAYYYTFLKYK
jgi:hypothetical protein